MRDLDVDCALGRVRQGRRAATNAPSGKTAAEKCKKLSLSIGKFFHHGSRPVEDQPASETRPLGKSPRKKKIESGLNPDSQCCCSLPLPSSRVQPGFQPPLPDLARRHHPTLLLSRYRLVGRNGKHLTLQTISSFRGLLSALQW